MNDLTLNIPSVVITLILAIIVGWLSNNWAVKREREKYARLQRREIYTKFLSPFAEMFASLKDSKTSEEKAARAIAKYINSKDGRMNQIEHVLLGTDESVRAWNDMVVNTEDSNALKNMANLFLAIRKGFVGKTTLDSTEVIQFLCNEKIDYTQLNKQE